MWRTRDAIARQLTVGTSFKGKRVLYRITLKLLEGASLIRSPTYHAPVPLKIMLTVLFQNFLVAGLAVATFRVSCPNTLL